MSRSQIFGLVLMVPAVINIIFGYLNGAPWWEPVIVLEVATYWMFKETAIEN